MAREASSVIDLECVGGTRDLSRLLDRTVKRLIGERCQNRYLLRRGGGRAGGALILGSQVPVGR